MNKFDKTQEFDKKHLYIHKNHCVFVNVRTYGFKDNDCSIYGGRYYPADAMKSARFVFYAFVPHSGYDEQGIWHCEYMVCIITCWNSAYASPGKGLADIMAKVLSNGKTISFQAERKHYFGQKFIDGKAVKTESGDIIRTPKVGYYMIPGTVLFGNDSDRQLAIETLNYKGEIDFESRPKHMSKIYTPGDTTYGYAKVTKL